MTFAFTVHGDPVPYLRMTQGQVKLMRIPDHKLRPDGLRKKNQIRRYLDYKERAFLISSGLIFDRSPKSKIVFNAIVFFGSGRHGDCENVRKGLQDAIFFQDKMVAGSVDFYYDKENPRVECEIII